MSDKTSSGDWLDRSRTAALRTIVGAVGLADAISFAGSYRGLYTWALTHQLPRWESLGFPLMVDVFIIVGELSVFVLVIEAARERRRQAESFRHKAWHRLPGWGLTILGLAGSVAGNVGDVWSASLATRIGHAVPPLAASLALAVGLGVLKRLAMSQTAPVRITVAPEPATVPANRSTVVRTGRKRGTEPPEFAPALAAYRASVAAGAPLSQRQLAYEHLNGNRHAARRAIAATMNGAVT